MKKLGWIAAVFLGLVLVNTIGYAFTGRAIPLVPLLKWVPQSEVWWYGKGSPPPPPLAKQQVPDSPPVTVRENPDCPFVTDAVLLTGTKTCRLGDRNYRWKSRSDYCVPKPLHPDSKLCFNKKTGHLAWQNPPGM